MYLPLEIFWKEKDSKQLRPRNGPEPLEVTYIFYHLDSQQENECVLRCYNTVVTIEVTDALQQNIFHQLPLSYFLSP